MQLSIILLLLYYTLRNTLFYSLLPHQCNTLFTIYTTFTPNNTIFIFCYYINGFKFVKCQNLLPLSLSLEVYAILTEITFHITIVMTASFKYTLSVGVKAKVIFTLNLYISMQQPFVFLYIQCSLKLQGPPLSLQHSQCPLFHSSTVLNVAGFLTRITAKYLQ